MTPHIILMSYNLEYFTVAEITGVSKRPNRTKKLGRPLASGRYLVDYVITYARLFFLHGCAFSPSEAAQLGTEHVHHDFCAGEVARTAHSLYGIAMPSYRRPHSVPSSIYSSRCYHR
jgi:hypothetical protein